MTALADQVQRQKTEPRAFDDTARCTQSLQRLRSAPGIGRVVTTSPSWTARTRTPRAACAGTGIAGGETAGIPFAALVAERMGLPMTYVRKKPKGYGRDAQIEGVMSEGDRVLLVEDLTTDGGSKLKFVDAIRKTGASCGHTAVIFYYGIFPDTIPTLAEHGVALHHLCTWADVVAEARRAGDFDFATLSEVERFLAHPDAWQPPA